jgi:adenine-specific DNA methylase
VGQFYLTINKRDLLEHCLVASLTLARTCQYGSGSEYIYQVMRKQAQEKNVWELFTDKVTSFIKFKKQYADFQFADIADKRNLMTIKNCDYRDLLSEHKNFFDIIYTDPPYTDQVPFLERSQLYRDWLHTFYDKNNQYLLSDDMLKNEIVITNAPSRVKSKSGTIQYYNDINEMFKHFYTSLKPGGRVVLTIKLGSNKYLLTLAEYIKLAKKKWL